MLERNMDQSLKNLRFGPVMDMEDLLNGLNPVPVIEDDIFLTQYGYYCVELRFGFTSYYLFLEDESGRFIEGND